MMQKYRFLVPGIATKYYIDVINWHFDDYILSLPRHLFPELSCLLDKGLQKDDIDRESE